MEIRCKENIQPKSQDEFHAIDKVVTGYAFDIHNEIGRFCDEKIYQQALIQNCKDVLIKSNSEVELVLTYKDYIKKYKIDLLIDNGIIYELKAVESLNKLHKHQLLNYLLLTGIKHGKLLNFRSKSVEHEFVSTTLNPEDRYDYSINTIEWIEKTKESENLKLILLDLLKEWGVFLDYRLFNEALIHFLGGFEKVIFPVEVYFNKKIVGKQKMQLLNSETAFHLSAITKSLKTYEKNIKRLLDHTNVKAIQWINFNKLNITMKTIITDL